MNSGDLVHELRARAGLSQRALAALVGRPQATVARWESGRHSPSLEVLTEIARTVGLELTIGIANADDSYDRLIAERWALTPEERLRQAALAAGFYPDPVLWALAEAEVRHVLIGRAAEALHGSPIAIGRPALAIVPATGHADAIASALEGLGATGPIRDEHYRGLDDRELWSVPIDVIEVRIIPTPAGTHGYEDLAREAVALPLAGVSVRVASVRDLARIAEAAPREEDRFPAIALRRLRELELAGAGSGSALAA